MRNTIAAAALAMLASSGSAFAADCTKGLLWPYVRNPGDCLTEDEIKTGVYQGAPQGPVDVDNIKSPAPAQPAIPVTAQDCHETGIWPFRSEECTPIAKTSATNSAPPPQPAVSNSSPPAPVPAATPAAPAPAPAPAVVTQTTAAPAAAPAVVTQTTTAPAAGSCTKSLLWPFVRDSGDCPTAVERTGTPNPVTGRTSTPTQTAAPAAPAVSTQARPAPTPAVAQNCHETGIWPFRSEECTPLATTSPTNSAPAPRPAAANTQPAAQIPVAQAAQPVAQPQVTAATPASARCSKGLLWPFVRDSGDCATEVEKIGTPNPVTGRASAPAATATTAMPAVARQTTPAPAPAATMAQAATASCGKSWLWPFVRDSGDCPTAVEKSTGAARPAPVQASAPPAAAPAAMPAVVRQTTPAPAPAPTMAQAATASCGKSWLWPFVRDSGDCPTAVEKSTGAARPAPVQASAPPATAPAAMPAVMTQTTAPAPAEAPTQPAPATASCNKGLLWPFVREPGDCPTSADKGQTH